MKKDRRGADVTTSPGIAKCQTGIHGFDGITRGGLPQGRPALICGGAGCGKTIFGIEFLVRGAAQFDEPGVLMMFEETEGEVVENLRSLGFDLNELVRQRKLVIDYVRIEASEIEETGEYDLEGLFVRLGHAIDSIGAKRVLLDTLESLFGGLGNTGILRAELRRLFRWLKDRRVTTVITAERGENTLTRHGLEEYVADCVILLDHRVNEQTSTRRLRVVKYRGSAHGTNEYPFLIDQHGISVLPITSVGLKHGASSERVSSGLPQLDALLSGAGFYRGATVLISGTAGTGKTSLAAHFADTTCRGGERCLYYAFEESPAQVIRNMQAIGLDLNPWVEKDLLKIEAERPTTFGLEMHLLKIHTMVAEFAPRAVIVDPISNFISTGVRTDVKGMLTRLIDLLKTKQITLLFTSLTAGGNPLEMTEEGISSLVDTWIMLRDIEVAGARHRRLYTLKSRGMSHSNKVASYVLTDHGIVLHQDEA